MYKAFFPLVLVISVGSAGCESKEAAAARRAKRFKENSPAWEEPSRQTETARLATPMEAGKSAEKLRVELEEIAYLEKGRVEAGEVETGYTLEGGEEPAPPTTRLGLRVKVVNDYETLKILVKLDRFELETGSGKKIRARTIPSQEPCFPEVYLKGGQSVAGWLVFDVPQGEKKLTLTSSLRIPPLRIPLPVRGE